MEEHPLTSHAAVRAYLGLGANLGNAEQTIRDACANIDGLPTTRMVAAASLYRTSPVGYADQPDFFNTVIAIDTALDARMLLEALHGIERTLGRQDRPRWHEREIDIDILDFGGAVIAWDDVVIPHPRMAERRFVLVPFAEIAPDVIPAGFRHTVAELLLVCPDTGSVERAGSLHELHS